MVLTKRTAGLPLICLVCGDVARGINFDLMTCMSCKAFFRRHAAKTSLHLLQCPLGSNCEINIRTRGACAACRLRKCLKLGMNAQLIRNAVQKSFKGHRFSEHSVLPSPKPLSLLDSDRSTLTSDEWTLFSNILHAYDATNIINETNSLLQQQVSLPPKIRSKGSTALFIIRYFYASVRSLLEKSPFFTRISDDARLTLVQHNAETVGSFNVTFVIRELNALANDAFLSGCTNFYGAETTDHAHELLSRLEPNGTLVKVMLFICAYAGNCSIVRFNPTVSPSVKPNTLILFHIQEMLVTMFWKYLSYQYGFDGAVRRFSSLVKYLLDLLSHCYLRANAEHWQMVDLIVEESARTLAVNHSIK